MELAAIAELPAIAEPPAIAELGDIAAPAEVMTEADELDVTVLDELQAHRESVAAAASTPPINRDLRELNMDKPFPISLTRTASGGCRIHDVVVDHRPISRSRVTVQ